MTLQLIRLLVFFYQSESLFSLLFVRYQLNASDGISFWMHLFLSTVENSDGSRNYLFSCLQSSNDFYSFAACSIFVRILFVFALYFLAVVRLTFVFGWRSCIAFSHTHFIRAFLLLWCCCCVQFSCSRSIVGQLFCSFGLVFARAHLYTFVRSKCAIDEANKNKSATERSTVMHQQLTSESESVPRIVNKLTNETLSLCGSFCTRASLLTSFLLWIFYFS